MTTPQLFILVMLANSPARAEEAEAVPERVAAEAALCQEADTAELIVVSLKKRRQIQAGCRWLNFQIEVALELGPRESCDSTQLSYLRHARKICRKHGG